MSVNVTIQKGPLNGGGLDPLGTVSVPIGENSFMIHPYEGAHLTTIDLSGDITLGTLTQYGETSPDMYYIQQYFINSDGIITVNFELDTPTDFQVTISTGSYNGGTVSPFGSVTLPAGDSSITIMPNADATVLNITATGGVTLGTLTPSGNNFIQPFTVSGDGTITVNFTPLSSTYNITINSNPSVQISIDNTIFSATPYTGTLNSGNHTLSAPATTIVGSNTYDFVNWQNNTKGIVIATSTSATINLTEDTIFSATYKLRSASVTPPYMVLVVGAFAAAVTYLLMKK